jgi:hypothetical protein
MLEALTKASLVAAVVFVAALIFFSSWKSSKPNAPQQQQISQQGENNKSAAKDGHEGIFDKIAAALEHFVRILDRHNGLVGAIGTLFVAIFTGVLVVATAALFYSSEKVANAAKQSAIEAGNAVKLARENSERQLRAYVFSSEQKALNVIVGQSPSVQMLVKNTGLTPAADVVSWAGIGVESFPLQVPLMQATPEFMKTASRRNVGPGGGFKMEAVWTQRLTDQHMQLLANGRAAVFFWGEITYTDTFQRKHTTHFRSYYGGDAGLRPDGYLTDDTEGNDAD